MNKLFSLLAFLAISLSCPVLAGEIDNTLSTTKENQTANTETWSLPDIENLPADWWISFDSSPADFNQRILLLEKVLNEISTTLPLEHKKTAIGLKKEIINNLVALNKVRSIKINKPIKKSTLQNNYSVFEWLDLIRKQRSNQRKVNDSKSAIKHIKNALKVANSQYDNKMANYINSRSPWVEKTIHGMQIIAKRSALELAKKRFFLEENELINVQEDSKSILNEQNIARDRLQVNSADRVYLEKDFLKLERLLEEVRKNIEIAQSNVLSSIIENTNDTNGHKLKEQQVIYFLASEANIRSKIELNRSILILHDLLANTETNINITHKNLDLLDKFIKKTTSQHDEWLEESLREQNQSHSQESDYLYSELELPPSNERRNKTVQKTQLKLFSIKELLTDLNYLSDVCRSILAKREGVVRYWFISTVDVFDSSSVIISGLLTTSLFNIGETPVTAFGLLRVVFLISLALMLSFFLRRILGKISERNEGISSALYTIGRLSHYVILLVGIMIALSSIGLDFSNLALVVGALSVGIGFGLQSVVNNFVSGLILLFERTLKVGDFVELDSGVLGVVMEINVRSTLINTNDNVDIIVPNSELVSAKVTNWTLRDATRRMRVPFGVAYGTDKNLVKTAVLEAAENVSVTLKTPKKYEPQVWLVDFGESSLNFELVVWVSQAAVKRPSSVMAAYLWEIETALNKYNIEIPFPQRDLHVRSFSGNEAQALAGEYLKK